ncbi:hypothetical protein AWB98_01265 [Mycolicibacterium conceptionense]|nr:hypothetical protein [Mycolicibacterium conceptionense]ORV20957.1 hypothetical protein AWB98_01265 [Mycolicibacterium conceptionense]
MAVHRNKPAQDWTEVEDKPFDGGPRLTGLRANGEDWPDRTRQKWQVWRRMPHCILWTESDWEFAFDTLELVARFHSGGGSISLIAEIRTREKLMGTTLDSRRDLRIRYIEPQKTAPLAVVKNVDDFRDL